MTLRDRLVALYRYTWPKIELPRGLDWEQIASLTAYHLERYGK